jgi:tubulin--tyrosine ligase
MTSMSRINNRKFDIRCFVLLTTVNGILKGYWYYDGYIRTSSEEFTLTDLGNTMVHLTNDAVQKKGEQFGRFENQNKVFSSLR